MCWRLRAIVTGLVSVVLLSCHGFRPGFTKWWTDFSFFAIDLKSGARVATRKAARVHRTGVGLFDGVGHPLIHDRGDHPGLDPVLQRVNRGGVRGHGHPGAVRRPLPHVRRHVLPQARGAHVRDPQVGPPGTGTPQGPARDGRRRFSHLQAGRQFRQHCLNANSVRVFALPRRQSLPGSSSTCGLRVFVLFFLKMEPFVPPARSFSLLGLFLLCVCVFLLLVGLARKERNSFTCQLASGRTARSS